MGKRKRERVFFSGSMKKKYGKMNIDEIEKKIHGCDIQMKNGLAGLVTGLDYLDFTDRFRENKRYVKSSFKKYLTTEFHYNMNQYETLKLAFEKFPEETAAIGVGNISKIIGRAKKGSRKEKMEPVITALAEKDEVRQKKGKGPLPQADIDTFIDDELPDIPQLEKELKGGTICKNCEKLTTQLEKTKEHIKSLEGTIAFYVATYGEAKKAA